MVIVSSTVPPAPIDAAEKLLATVGRDGVTASTSDAEHTPATVQEPDGLLLETLSGGAMLAILVTCCCAWVSETAKNDRNSSPEAIAKRITGLQILDSEIERHKAFKKSKKTFSVRNAGIARECCSLAKARLHVTKHFSLV